MSKNVFVNGHLYFASEAGRMYIDGVYMGRIDDKARRDLINERYLKDAKKAKQGGVVVESMSLTKLQEIRQRYMNRIDRYVAYAELDWGSIRESNGHYEACVEFLNKVIVSKGGKADWVAYQA